MPLQPPPPSLLPGFHAPVPDAQRVFKALMRAMSRPGTIVPLVVDLVPPSPLTAETAAILLALADHDTALWIDGAEAATQALSFLAFHTGVRMATQISAATFVAAASAAHMPDLGALAQGTPEYPDRSATLLVPVTGFRAQGLRLEGPGIDGGVSFGFDGMAPGFEDAWARNRAGYPCGVDIVFAAPGAVAALPRSVRIMGGG